MNSVRIVLDAPQQIVEIEVSGSEDHEHLLKIAKDYLHVDASLPRIGMRSSHDLEPELAPDDEPNHPFNMQ